VGRMRGLNQNKNNGKIKEEGNRLTCYVGCKFSTNVVVFPISMIGTAIGNWG